MTQQERRMYLIKSLLAEDRRYEDVAVPAAEGSSAVCCGG